MFVTISKKIANFLNGTGPAPPIAKVYNPPIPQPGRFPAPPRKRHLPPVRDPTAPPVAFDPALKEQRCVSRKTLRREQRTFVVSQRILENIKRRRVNHWHPQPPPKPSVTDAPQLEVPVPFEVLHQQALTLPQLGDAGDDLDIFLHQLQILGNQREMAKQLSRARCELNIVGRRVKEAAEVKARKKAEMEQVERNIQEMRRKRKLTEKKIQKHWDRYGRDKNFLKHESIRFEGGGKGHGTRWDPIQGYIPTHPPMDDPAAKHARWEEHRAAVQQNIERQNEEWAARDAARADAEAAHQRELEVQRAQAEAQRRQAEYQRALETERLRVQKAAARRQADENRRAEERRLAQEAVRRQAEAARLEEERRRAEAAHREAERIRAEAARLEGERIRALEAARQRSEQARREAERQRAEQEQRQRAAEDARRAYERRQAEAARAEAERARQAAEQSGQTALEQRNFKEYGMKWDLLRGGRVNVGEVHFFQVPWPVVGAINSVDQITQPAMEMFIFHQDRDGYKGRSRKEVLKMEILRWHPDKFNNTVIPKVIPADVEATTEGADRVVKILTAMMETA